jgi:hypothetical protein
MTGIPIIDIDAVPEEEQAALAASMRALLRLQDLDVGEGDFALCLSGGALALVSPDGPDVPGVPALTTYTAELTGDNTVDTGLLATLTAPTADAAHPPAAAYVIEIWRSTTLGGTYTAWKTILARDLATAFACSTRWFYKARARGVSAAGNMGAYSTLTAVGVAPLQYLATVPQPAAPVVTPKANGCYIKADKATFGNYKETILFANAVEIDRKRGTVFNDNTARSAGDSITYTTQFVDSQDRVGLVSSGATVAYRIVQDGDLDQNAPNVPGVPAITTFTAELTGDDTVDTGLLATLTAPSVDGTHPAAKRYVVEVWRSATLAGTYAAWKKFPTDDLDVAFPASSEWFYKARAKAISSTGKHGAYSTLTAAGVAPLQYLATVPQPAAPVVTPKANGCYIKADKATFGNYKETILFANAVEIDRKRGTVFNDNTARSAGDSITYTTQFVDSQDRVGLVSSGATVAYRIVQDGDLDQNAPNVPGVPAITTFTAELTGDDTVDTGLLATLTAPSVDGTHPAAKRYVVEVWRSATLAGTYAAWKKFPTDDLDVAFPASSEWFYKARAKAISSTGKHGAYSTLTAAGVAPLQYLATVPQPAAPVVTPKANGCYIKADKATFGNYKETILFANAVEIDRKRGTVFNDNTARSAGDSITYTTQFVDSQDRVGLVSSGATVAYRIVQDGDVDQTAPGAPGAPALTPLTTDLDKDGGLDAALTATWTAPGSGRAPRKYRVEIWRRQGDKGTDGNNVTGYTLWKNKFTNQVSHTFKGNIQFFHKCRIFPISPNDIEGTASVYTTVGVAPLQYLATVPQPAAPVVTPKANGCYIKADKATFGNYKETILFANAVEIDRKRGTVFNDNTARSAGDSITYTTQFVDSQDRVGLVSSGATVAYRIVQDGDLDQNAPNVPGVPAITTFTAELTGDDTVDTGLLATLTAPSVDGTHPAAKRYVVEVWRSATLAGTYAAWKKFPTDDLDVAFPASSEWFYKARAKAISSTGKHGAYSTLTAAGVAPLQYLATVPQPAAPVVTPKANGCYIKADKATFGNYKETILFANAVEIDRKRGTVFNDNTARSAGDSITYTTQFVDSQDRVGLVSSGATVAYRIVQDGDVDQTAPGAPGAPALTPLTTDVDKDGSLDAALTAAWTAPVSGRTPRKYRVEIWRRKGDKGTDGNNVTGYTLWKNEFTNQINHTFKGNAQYFHKCRIFPISPNDIEGTGSAYTTVGVVPGQPAAPTAPTSLTVTGDNLGFRLGFAQIVDPDYDHTEVGAGASSSIAPADDSNLITAFVARGQTAAPSVYVYCPKPVDGGAYVWVRHINKSKAASNWVYAGLWGTTGILTNYITPHAASDYAEAIPSGSISLPAATETEVANIVVSGTNCYGFLIFHAFINDDGSSSRSFDIKLYDDTAQIDGRGGNAVANGAVWSDCYFYPNPPPGNRTLRFKITCTNATAVKGRRLRVLLLKR